ncbi:MAG TPA: NAD(P)-dependent oxidoreductase [Candidatus Lokiarchaeia archaeon]|nr:NAD(P)-dependent oxidoreductase [Candidatus Lokiarchaeia archaeon]
MAKIAIIGSNGQLGSDIKALLSDDHDIVPLEHDTFLVEDKGLVISTLEEIKPDFVINTAALHNCAECEENPQQAFLINGTALKYLSDACNAIDATLFHFSTDYIFGIDQSRSEPYLETDIPGPVQVYGVTKLAGEAILKAYCKKYFCLRTSGLYGLKGTKAKKYANFIEMMIALGTDAMNKEEKLPSAADQILTFNPTTEIAKVVKSLLASTEYGLYHAVCGGFSSRSNFVRAIFENLNMPVEVVDVESAYFKPTYEQPKFSALSNAKLQSMGIELPDWRTVLEEYLQAREKRINETSTI